MSVRRLAAIMFTDIAGYTSLMGKDEKKAFEYLKKNRRIHWRLIKKYKGRLLKEIGDGILASFPSNIEAVMCALSIQTAVKEMDIPLRIGIHQGDVIFEKKDVLGDGVNIASRIQAVADTNEIVISEKVYSDIKNKEGLEIEFHSTQSLKGVEGETNIYKVNCTDSSVLDFAIDTGELIKPLVLGTKTIIAGVLIILILAFALYYFLPKIIEPALEVDKSIAVLPLISLSGDPEKQYLADGVMDAITGHLSKISGLRVIPRTSVEQYRDTKKTASEIGNELNVSYLIEGSFQMYGNTARLTIQLVNAQEESHEWFKEYDREWKDIFIVQSDVAKDIANEIKVIISPEEQQLIEIIPTGNLTAYDFYMRAEDEHNKFRTTIYSGQRDTVALKKAITLYYRALEYDSTYALAYTGLARAHWDKVYWDDNIVDWDYSKEVTDSVFILINIALSYDDQCDEAYFYRGAYFGWVKNDINKALNDLNRAIQINPNYAWAYFWLGALNITPKGNYVEGIKNYHKAASIDHSYTLPEILTYLAGAYGNIGFIDKADYYYKEAIKLDGDTTWQYRGFLYYLEYLKSDLKTRLEIDKKNYADNSSSIWHVIALVKINNILGNTDEAYNYAVKSIELDDPLGMVEENVDQIGYAFWQAGKKEEAKHYFNIAIEWNQGLISNNMPSAGNKTAHCNLAKVYTFLEDKEKAYQYLDEVDKKNFFTELEIDQIKYEPLFNSIREEERFQKILQNMEIKYQKEHERVKAWLEENNML